MKNNEIKKKSKIKFLSFSLAVITILIGGCLYFYNQAKFYRLALENTYKHSLQDFNDYVSNIYGYLDKGLYVGTPYQLSNISARLLSDSRAASVCLSSLPASELHLDNTFKFLSQVGAYAASLNKKYHHDNKISDKEYKTLESLRSCAKKLNNYVSDLEDEMIKNNIDLDSNKMIISASKTKNRQDNNDVNFLNLEKNFVNYPTLIYDGPFSDHISNKAAELTKNLSEVSLDQAKKIAALATGINEDKLSSSQEENSNFDLYCFTDKNVSIGVTKKGGIICYILKISNIEQSYYEINNNCFTVNFAYKQDDIIIYPDLIKVSVALDNGEILSVDSRGYINNHKERKIKEPKKTKQEAKAVISNYLTVLKEARRAIIPTEGENEVETYEFVCRGSNNDTVLVYINSNTLEEEQILILIESEDGILTI